MKTSERTLKIGTGNMSKIDLLRRKKNLKNIEKKSLSERDIWIR